MVTREPPAPARAQVRGVRPPPSAYSAGWSALLLAVDVAMFVLASVIGTWIGSFHQVHHWDRQSITRLFAVQAFSIALWIWMFARLGLYRRSYALSIKDELYYTAAALTIGMLPQLVIFTIVPAISPSRIALASSLAASLVIVSVSRALIHGVGVSGPLRRGRRIAIVGRPERISLTLDALDLTDNDHVLVLEVGEMDEILRQMDWRSAAGTDKIEWLQKARAWDCHRIILTEVLPPELMPQLLLLAAKTQVQFAFAPPRIRCQSYSLSLQTEGRQALIVPSQLRACTARAQLFKRLFDVPIAFAGLVLLSPVMLLAALCIFIESGGPVLYAQERVGLGGREFRIFKFRSMRHDAEAETGAVWAGEGDERRTRVGAVLRRFSIDEFPQLFNVLRGDMSLVGPRPERPIFVQLFRETLDRYDERHMVRPGITGWSQVHMKRVLTPADAGEKLAYDLHYVEQWTPFLDISVLFQTLFEFPFHKAA